MATPITVSFHTLGCKLNFSETSTIRRQFEDQGYAIRGFEDGADVTVINTCSVTDFADRKCRKAVRSALRKNPACKVVVVGCYAQLKPKEIAAIDGVDLVLGAGQKFQILHYLSHLEQGGPKGLMHTSEIDDVHQYNGAFSYGDRTRSFLKVQDGCNYQCSFCTIPQARGQSRSATIEDLLIQVRDLASRGAKEVVLTGVNIGDFGLIEGKRHERFVDLLQRLDQEVGIERFRISSIEPNLCSEQIISFVASSEKFVPHFHMPLQSGNNKQLRQMRRRYLSEQYRERVEIIKHYMPHACIGADVIVGFPGENDQDFDLTVDFIDALSVSYLHVFTYSERAGTPASTMEDSVPMNVRRARNQQLRRLSDRKKRQFTKHAIGQTRKVLLEKCSKPNHWTGFTDNYIKVIVPNRGIHQINEMVEVTLETIQADGQVKGFIKSEIPV